MVILYSYKLIALWYKSSEQSYHCTHTHTYGSYSMESFNISLKADLRTMVAVLGLSPTIMVSPGISVKHRGQ